jgi:hypothetical protein
MRRRILLVGVAVFFAAVLCWQFYLSVPISILIDAPSGDALVVKMPRGDARCLDRFFREILVADSLAYTLVGAKPLSFVCYRKAGGLSWMRPSLRISRGWKVWKRYQHLFQTDRLLFWSEESPWVGGVSCLILADVKQCNQLASTADFRNVVAAPDLFRDVGHTSFFHDTLKMHEALIGILLGFGQENAWLYYQNGQLAKWAKLPPIGEADRGGRFYSWRYCTLQTIHMSDLGLPRFVGDPESEESRQLVNKYRTAREQIRRYYEGKDFLSATLSLYKYGLIF